MFRFRAAPLRHAAILAIGFIVVRVLYRILFHGVDGSGTVLVDLPVVRLPAPFAHVTMLGPVTSGGLWNSVESALPIAAVIFAFGAVNACVDLSKLFARGARGGPLRGAARTLVIAWATVPALGDAVRQVALARKLRGSRGAAALLVPLLERTVERAVAIAAAMEVRGFGAQRSVDAGRTTPIEFRDVVLAYGACADAADADPGAPVEGWTLAVEEFVVPAGNLVLVSGPTGSGKSTLLHALSGLHTHFDDGELHGFARVGGVDRRTVPPRETAGFIGVVLQNPRIGFASETVADEIGFAPTARGVVASIVAARVAEAAARVGVTALLGRDIRALSAGEATLVAIAAALVERPRILLVDEPLADLDREARLRIRTLLDSLAHEHGVCVVVAEHRVGELAAVADARFELRDGRVVRVATGAGLAPAGEEDASSDGRSTAATGATTGAARSGGEARLEARGIHVALGGRVAVDEASLDLCAGEIVALAGPNGAGKSTLLLALALPKAAGGVRVNGIDVARLRRRARRAAVALVPEASDDLLCATSAEEECRRADREAGAPGGTTRARFLAFLGADGGTGEGSATAARLLASHPRDLSTGERRCLAIAIQLAADASVLLIDEPTRGLDARARSLVAAALRTAAGEGRAVAIATHDHAFASELAERTVEMRDGRLGAGALRTAVRS